MTGWFQEQIADLFHTRHKVETQQVVRNRGQRCDEVTTYLTDVVGPVILVVDLLSLLRSEERK